MKIRQSTPLKMGLYYENSSKHQLSSYKTTMGAFYHSREVQCVLSQIWIIRPPIRATTLYAPVPNPVLFGYHVLQPRDAARSVLRSCYRIETTKITLTITKTASSWLKNSTTVYVKGSFNSSPPPSTPLLPPFLLMGDISSLHDPAHTCSSLMQ